MMLAGDMSIDWAASEELIKVNEELNGMNQEDKVITRSNFTLNEARTQENKYNSVLMQTPAPIITQSNQTTSETSIAIVKNIPKSQLNLNYISSLLTEFNISLQSVSNIAFTQTECEITFKTALTKDKFMDINHLLKNTYHSSLFIHKLFNT